MLQKIGGRGKPLLAEFLPDILAHLSGVESVHEQVEVRPGECAYAGECDRNRHTLLKQKMPQMGQTAHWVETVIYFKKLTKMLSL